MAATEIDANNAAVAALSLVLIFISLSAAAVIASTPRDSNNRWTFCIAQPEPMLNGFGALSLLRQHAVTPKGIVGAAQRPFRSFWKTAEREAG